jgi:hypothetical protein
MWRLASGLFAVLLALVAISQSKDCLSQVSQNSIPAPPANTDVLPDVSGSIVSLVQQGHDLNYQLGVDSRVYLLGRQIEMISRRSPELAREWIDELFALSFEQGKGTSIVAIQQMAINALAQIDPDRALDMLDRMSTPEAGQKPTMISPKIGAATSIFSALVARDGMNAIPVVEQEAERLAYGGTYPYGALGAAANAAVMKEWRSNREHAVSVLQAIFERAFMRYSERPETYPDNYAFGDMLIQMGGGLPKEAVRPALDLLVKNLLTTDTKTNQVQAQMLACDGHEVKAENAIDAALLRLASLIGRVDPEMAQQLGESRPALRVAIEETKAGCERSLKIGPKPPNARPRDPNLQLQADALQFSHINVDAAVAKAEQISDESLRTYTMLRIAGDIAGDEPERARKLITEAQMKIKNGDIRMQLNLINAQASLAAAQDKIDDLRELLQRGFELAGRGGTTMVGAGPLVEVGMQNDPNLTMGFVQNLPASPEKAQLLMAAASALEIGRLPMSSRAHTPTQQEASPNQAAQPHP